MADPVEDPPHYTRLNPQPRKVILAWDLNYCLGNAVKYIARAGYKEDYVQDLDKAINYLQEEKKRYAKQECSDE